jgi:hypothetical protein
VTAEQADQLRAKISEAGFQETDWLQRRAGPDITSADDVEQPAFVILMNMLVQIIAQRSVKKG